MIRIERFTDEDRAEYENLVETSNNGMLSHTLKWRRVLQRFTNAEPAYVVAKLNNEIVGILPAFIKRNSEYGNVLNSLPFYGSHGGPIVSQNLSDDQRIRVKAKLLVALKELAKENSCALSTLVTTPFENDLPLFRKTLKPDFIDSRIGQITVFPKKISNIENEILYNTIEKRCRTAIRKAQKSGVKIEFAQDLKNLDTLVKMHQEGISKKHGICKPSRFFEILFDIFSQSQNKSFKLLFARNEDEEIIGGLLLFYYKNGVEYFTPCFKLEYSKLQPLSLLIYEGMKDSIQNGYTAWNLGGTWKKQQGVYMFKRSWGAKDYPYYYFINSYENISKIQSLQREEILSEYRWFYVLPFSELKAKPERE